MAQYYRVRKPDTGRRKLFVATALILIIFLLDMLSGGRLRAQVRMVGVFLSTNIAAITSGISESGFFATRHRLAAENAALREELAAYQALDAEYRALRDENARLKEFANMVESEKGVTAAVTSFYTASPYGTFSIAAGRAEGVAPGDIVANANGFSLGRVDTADLHSSLVVSLFAPGEIVEGLIGDVPISLDGQGGGNARGKVAREVQIAVGDIVSAPRERGMPIGVVGRVETDASGAFQDVLVAVPTNFASLRFVYVIGE